MTTMLAVPVGGAISRHISTRALPERVDVTFVRACPLYVTPDTVVAPLNCVIEKPTSRRRFVPEPTVWDHVNDAAAPAVQVVAASTAGGTGVAVFVGVFVGVRVGVLDGVGVFVGVLVGIGVFVGVGVLVGVFVGVLVGIAVFVAVGVDVGETRFDA